MSKTTLNINDTTSARDVMADAYPKVQEMLSEGNRYGVKVTLQHADMRTLQQNAIMWVMLTDISNQVEWHGLHLEPAEWKDMLSASLKKQKVVPGIDDGFVVVGTSTSNMSKQEMADMIELMNAFGAEKGVKFGAPAYREAILPHVLCIQPLRHR